MAILDDVADGLAQRALDLMEAQADAEDDQVIRKVSEAIGNASPTLQEAFLTQVRIRRAERRALVLLESMMPKTGAAAPAPAAAPARPQVPEEVEADIEIDEVIHLPKG